jgi:predicted amidohydrolase
MKWTLLQIDLAWRDIQTNIEAVDALLESTEVGEAVVLPEMWTTGFTMQHEGLSESMSDKGVSAMLKWAEKYEALVMGSLIIREGHDVFNRFIAVFPKGDIITYDKKHLFSFAQEDQHYTPGDKVITFDYKGWTICPQICYDLRFPESVRYSNERPYHVLVYVANWPARRSYPWQTLLRARAIENQAYVVGVNRVGLDGNAVFYCGDSALIDYSGNPVVLSSPGQHVLHVETDLESLEAFRSKFPFLKDRDVQ